LDLTSLGRQNGTATAEASLLYRRGLFGVWAGYGPERYKTPIFTSGIWRQLGTSGLLSISTRSRGMQVGAHPSRFWTVHVPESTYTDTGGWGHYTVPRQYGESASVGSRRLWMETEGRISWALSRLS